MPKSKQMQKNMHRNRQQSRESAIRFSAFKPVNFDQLSSDHRLEPEEWLNREVLKLDLNNGETELSDTEQHSDVNSVRNITPQQQHSARSLLQQHSYSARTPSLPAEHVYFEDELELLESEGDHQLSNTIRAQSVTVNETSASQAKASRHKHPSFRAVGMQALLCAACSSAIDHEHLKKQTAKHFVDVVEEARSGIESPKTEKTSSSNEHACWSRTNFIKRYDSDSD